MATTTRTQLRSKIQIASDLVPVAFFRGDVVAFWVTQKTMEERRVSAQDIRRAASFLVGAPVFVEKGFSAGFPSVRFSTVKP